jgi:hypothetical protein
MSLPRLLIIAAVAIGAMLSLARPFSPLQAFVPDPYFLRSDRVLDEIAKKEGAAHPLLARGRPFMIVPAALYLALCYAAFRKNQLGFSFIVLLIVPALAVFTFVRLLFGGGTSGGI